MELVATGLTAKTLKQQLSAEITEGQREEGLPYLWNTEKHGQNLLTIMLSPTRASTGTDCHVSLENAVAPRLKGTLCFVSVHTEQPDLKHQGRQRGPRLHEGVPQQPF